MDIETTREKQLLSDLKPVLDFLNLPTIITILSLNNKIMLTLSQTPYTFLYVLKRFYLKKEHLSLTHRKLFKVLLKKRIKLDINNLLTSEKKIYDTSLERLILNKNLVLNKFQDRSNCKWKFVQNGGDGWRYENTPSKLFPYAFASSFFLCIMSYRINFSEFSPRFISDFKEGRVVLKVGCFIARRFDCRATGGCTVLVVNNDRMLLKKQINKKSEDLPICSQHETNFIEIGFKISNKDLPQEENIEDCVIELLLHGKDEQFWKGWYGAKFTKMYLRGDFNYPLKIIE